MASLRGCTWLLAAATMVAARVDEQPGPQSSAILAFHETLGRVVLVESRSAPSAPEHAGVWSWDGQRWNRLGGASPPIRSLSAGIYDPARRQLLLFGGRVGIDGFSAGDLWAWDGRAWRDVTDAGVGVRNHHAMAYDEHRARAVMFGGVITPPTLNVREQLAQRETWTYPGDTWEWDGKRWRRMATVGPGARSGPALAFDGRRVVLFGGVGADRAYPGGTWNWDGMSWRQVAADGPPPRASHAMAYDRDRGVIWLYGGGYSDGSQTRRLDDLWQWDGERWTRVTTRGTSPGIRIGHAIAYDRARKRLVLFGGFGAEGSPMDDTWEWDGALWSEPSDRHVAPRGK